MGQHTLRNGARLAGALHPSSAEHFSPNNRDESIHVDEWWSFESISVLDPDSLPPLHVHGAYDKWRTLCRWRSFTHSYYWTASHPSLHMNSWTGGFPGQTQ